jgi:hypothetical protein
MQNQGNCNCGFLSFWAKKKLSRIQYDQVSNSFTLDLDNGISMKISYCPYCGGRNLFQVYLGHRSEGIYVCKCNLVKKWADLDGIPIEFDPESNSYYLLTKDKVMLPIIYCVSCGERQPFFSPAEFMAPSETEMSDVVKKLSSVRTIEDIRRLFGEPDQKIDKNYFADFSKVPDEWIEVKEQFAYPFRFEAFYLTVNEYEDGEVVWLISLKPKAQVIKNPTL